MNTQLTYEFETLEQLLDESASAGKLTAETTRINRAWRLAIPGNTDAVLEPYFRLYFDRLGELVSKNNIDALWPLFTELTTRHRRYVDPKSPWPEAGIPNAQQCGREVLNRLRGLPAAARIDGKLLDILEHIFTFHQLAPSQITIGRMHYLEALGEALLHWMEAQSLESVDRTDDNEDTEDLTESFIALLMLHNLNAAEFLKYCMDRVDDYAAARLAHDLTAENLSFAHQQQIALSLPVRNDTAYDSGLGTINHQVAAAIETRIRFVEYLHTEDARRREQGQKGHRLFIATSAAQLALGIGGMLTAGLFPKNTPGEVLRRASESFSTPGAPEPSYTTFRNNAYKKTSGNVKKLNLKIDAVRAAVNAVN